MEKVALRELLESIEENNYRVSQGVDPYQLSFIMMDNIGDTDDELRDRLIYSILYTWIDSGVLNSSQVYELFKIALDDDHLLKGLGRVDDSVFSRTFSVLVIANSITRHRKEKLIPKSDIERAFNRVLKFFNTDKDVRGYVEGKGWAHGAAHGADAMGEFARCEEIGYEGLIKILDAIHQKININYYGYVHFEDERMITAVKAILEREIIPIEEIEEWVRSFKKIEKIGKHPEDLVIKVNVSAFLKSLYFRLIDNPQYERITDVIRKLLEEINPFSKR